MVANDEGVNDADLAGSGKPKKHTFRDDLFYSDPAVLLRREGRRPAKIRKVVMSVPANSAPAPLNVHLRFVQA
jgi:hypothetical protein